MRLAVLDIGSNSIHLLVVDAHVGAPPMPATSHKEVLRLAEHLKDDGSITSYGQQRLVDFCKESITIAEQILAFATSAIRSAPNGDETIERIHRESGLTLNVMSGEEEARITFLAARRWFGWSAGNILLLDIGGGSLEIAAGTDEYPDIALSLPLGAGRMHSRFLSADQPSEDDIAALRHLARKEIGRIAGDVNRVGKPEKIVGSSKTFRSLAPAQRAELPGVSVARSGQVLAGAIVADVAFTIFGIESMKISPWALREGIIMRKLDLLDSSESVSIPRGRPLALDL